MCFAVATAGPGIVLLLSMFCLSEQPIPDEVRSPSLPLGHRACVPHMCCAAERGQPPRVRQPTECSGAADPRMPLGVQELVQYLVRRGAVPKAALAARGSESTGLFTNTLALHEHGAPSQRLLVTVKDSAAAPTTSLTLGRVDEDHVMPADVTGAVSCSVDLAITPTTSPGDSFTTAPGKPPRPPAAPLPARRALISLAAALEQDSNTFLSPTEPPVVVRPHSDGVSHASTRGLVYQAESSTLPQASLSFQRLPPPRPLQPVEMPPAEAPPVWSLAHERRFGVRYVQ